MDYEGEMKVFPRFFYDMFRPILDNYLKSYWNLKWKRNYVLYNARGMGLIDIRDILNGDTEEKLEILQSYANTFTSKYYDDRMLHIAKFVNHFITYKGDFNVWKKPEYWQTASETLNLRTGDCEDGAILIYKLAVLSGIPEWRIKVAAGWVENPYGSDSVGHAYVIYLSEQYNDWFNLDWCYWFDVSVRNYLEVPHRNNMLYQEIWWTINHVYTWAQHDTVIGEEV